MREWDSPEEALACLQAYSSSAAVGAALELGLPWLLEAAPLDHAVIAAALGVPQVRCRWWLETLVRLGLLERAASGYALTPGARRGVLGSYSRESWAFLAREERERFPEVLDWTGRLTAPPGSPGRPPSGYFAQITADPERARAFTRMLYDLHRPLAERLAAALDLTGCRRLVDLGGGSGVMSLALVRRYPGLTSMVVDIENVCAEGRAIAAEQGLGERVSFRGGDFRSAPLPEGCDAVLECDVGVYEEGLFSAVRAALPPGGRFAVADLLPEAEDDFPEGLLHWGFTGALARDDPGEPGQGRMTWVRLRGMLAAAGFRLGSETGLPDGFRLLEVHA